MNRADLITLLESVITDNTTGENTAARVRQILQEVINSTVNLIDNAVPKVLRIKINQPGGAVDPTMEILHSDFTGITFTCTRFGVGDYRINASAAAFTANKTFVSGGYVDADNSRYSRAFESSDVMIVISNYNTNNWPPDTLADVMVNQYFEIIVDP